MTLEEFVYEYQQRLNLTASIPASVFEAFANSFCGITRQPEESDEELLDRIANYLESSRVKKVSKSKPLTPRELQRMQMRPDVIGKMIEARRRSLGWSKLELSRRINVTVTTVSRWEQGKVDPSTVRLINFLMAGSEDSLRDNWMRRAIRAEGAIRDMANTIREYRGIHENDYTSQS